MKQIRFKKARALTRSMKPYWLEMAFTILLSFLKQFAALGGVFLTSYIVGKAMAGETEIPFMKLAAGVAVCIVLRALANFGEMYFAHDVAFRVIRDFRSKLFIRLCELTPAYSLKKKTGQIGQAFVGDVEILELFLAHTFGGFVVAVFMTLAITSVLCVISPILSVLMLLAAVGVFMVPYVMKKLAESQGRVVRERLADANSVTIEGVQGLRELLLFNSVESYRKKNTRFMNDMYTAQRSYGNRKGIEGLLTQILTGAVTVAVMIVSAALVSSGKLEFSLYPAAVMLSSMLLSPVIEVAGVAQDLGQVFAAAERIQEVFDADAAVKDLGKERIEDANPDIEFEHVSFAYEIDNPVLKDVSFKIHSGEKIALIGHSGEGKSTCANLLLRYWDVSEGAIRIGGHDIRNVTIDSLRQCVGAVQQENYLFNDTIRNNILLGRPDASEDMIREAARKARVDEFVDTLPNGYDTIVGEHGFALSGGQRQRIAIARTLLENPPVIIMDEAVSSLDTENEQDIQMMIDQEMEDKTVLMIAHRISTILFADRIILLENGSVLATGTHEELMHTCPEYRELIRSGEYTNK